MLICVHTCRDSYINRCFFHTYSSLVPDPENNDTPKTMGTSAHPPPKPWLSYYAKSMEVTHTTPGTCQKRSQVNGDHDDRI